MVSTSASVNVTVLAAAPGLFVQGSHAIVQNFPISVSTVQAIPPKLASTIIAYFTGAGAVSPQPADGAPAGSNPLSNVTPRSVSATIGSQTARSVVRRSRSRIRGTLAGEYRRAFRPDAPRAISR